MLSLFRVQGNSNYTVTIFIPQLVSLAQFQNISMLLLCVYVPMYCNNPNNPRGLWYYPLLSPQPLRPWWYHWQKKILILDSWIRIFYHDDYVVLRAIRCDPVSLLMASCSPTKACRSLPTKHEHSHNHQNHHYSQIGGTHLENKNASTWFSKYRFQHISGQ